MITSLHASWTIIGAGPAGLTAAFTLAKSGIQPLVLEQSNYIGGISRTHNWNGNRIDIGGHRFFTHSEFVKQYWEEMLDEPMIQVNRMSRIHYNGKFFDYPLRLKNTIFNLGFKESILILLSYIWAHVFPEKPEESFEQWVRNRFGNRIYRTFFKTYTEKVWGIPCNKIRADWAAQRIQGLNFRSVLMNSIRNTGKIKSLIKTFNYPRLGPGMMWESCAKKIKDKGGRIETGLSVTRLYHEDGRICSIDYAREGEIKRLNVENIISTMPLSALTLMLSPAPPTDVIKAANGLRYRDFLIVALSCNQAETFPDNWIYIHSPEVRVGRIQNFRNWSEAMIAEGNGTTLGMEYFCSRGDDLWNLDDASLIEIAKQEISDLGLIAEHEITGGHVIRELNAYPVYDEHYQTNVETLKEYLSKTFKNLQTAGRGGLHRYNNQDHSMLAGHNAAMALLGHANFDPWEVNTERSYHEEQVRA